MAILQPFARDAAPPPPSFALWALGFRPFYFAASVYASLAIALWVAQYAGWLPARLARLPLWHGHEMLSATRSR